MLKILKSKLNKRIAISLILVSFIAIGSTLAYLFDVTDLVTNTFTRMSIHTEIEEDENMTNLTKNPSVVNTDITDVLVRVRLSITGKAIFEENFGLAGIDDVYTSVFVDEEKTKPASAMSYWSIDTDSSDKYDCYYYYKSVLKGTENNGVTQYRTEPLFDKILKKTNNETDPYVEFAFNADNTAANKGDIEILKNLNSIEITVYQESVPVIITKDDGTVLNANTDNNGEIDIGIAKQIFTYLESNPDAGTSNNN